MQLPAGSSLIPRLIIIGGGSFSVIVGLIVMFGWYLGSVTLVRVNPTLAPMPFNAALCFLLSGSGLLMMVAGLPRIGRTAGAVSFAIGLLTLVQYMSGLNLGLDQLLIEDHLLLNPGPPDGCRR